MPAATSLKISSFEWSLNSAISFLSFLSLRYFQRLVLHSSITRAGWSSGTWYAGLPHHRPWTRTTFGWCWTIEASCDSFSMSFRTTPLLNTLMAHLSPLYFPWYTVANEPAPTTVGFLLSKETFDQSSTNKDWSTIDSTVSCWEEPVPRPYIDIRQKYGYSASMYMHRYSI